MTPAIESGYLRYLGGAMDGAAPRTARRLVHAATAVLGASTFFLLVFGVGGDLFDPLDAAQSSELP